MTRGGTDLPADMQDASTGIRTPRKSGGNEGQLLAARVVWMAVFLVTSGIFAASIPGHLEAMNTVCTAEPCVAGQLSPGEVRILGDSGFSLGFYAAYRIALDLVVAIGFCLVGVTIFWRKSRDRGALFVSFALVTFGLTWPDTFDSARLHPAWGGLAEFLSQLGLTSLLVFFFVFPDGRFIPRWTRWISLLAFAMLVLVVLFPGSWIVDPPQPVNVSAFVALWMCCLLAQVYRYRRESSPVQRQQTKWLVFGVTVLVGLLAGFLLPLVVFPTLARSGTSSLFFDLAGLTVAGSFGFLLVPVSIGIAILRHRLYDIDVIINRTIVYGSLTLSLTLTYLGGVVLLQTGSAP